jgi:integration host factor subunit beta
MARISTKPRPGRRARAAHETMTRRELAQKIHERLDRKHTASDMLDCVQAMIDSMAEAMLENRHIEFRDFGVFEVVERKARLGRNPKKPEDLFRIPPRKIIKFKIARKLMEKLSRT